MHAGHLAALQEMGFPEALARNALLLHRNQFDRALEWAIDSADNPAASQPLRCGARGRHCACACGARGRGVGVGRGADRERGMGRRYCVTLHGTTGAAVLSETPGLACLLQLNARWLA